MVCVSLPDLLANLANVISPGAASLIPTAIQIGAGLGGYASTKQSSDGCLAQGNSELFNPLGLEAR
jgi:hypothetical protein